MTWQMARLGSRFSLLFEPYARRVMHSGMGRFLDGALDLAVGFVEPDGTARVLPFTQDPEAVTLDNCEQFDRFNSVTYRAHSADYRVRFEFNVHSVFYPQDELLCTMPAFYLELRVSPVSGFRDRPAKGPTPESAEIFIRLKREHTQIDAQPGRIDLRYDNVLTPEGLWDRGLGEAEGAFADRTVLVRERLVSVNPGAEVTEQGDGLRLTLPVTDVGSGVKWRLAWAAYVDEPVQWVKSPDGGREAYFMYAQQYKSLDDVMTDALRSRDERLALSRRFEKLMGQAPLDSAQRHLLNQSWQSYLCNTWWCKYEGTKDPTVVEPCVKCPGPEAEDWFSVWEGSRFYHSPVDVEYNVCLLYLSLWPKLLRLQLGQWPRYFTAHGASDGLVVSHDVGRGAVASSSRYPHAMEVEQNCNYLLMLHTYAHWTGDRRLPLRLPHLVRRLAAYLLWTDRDDSGFPSQGVANAFDDALPATQFSRKQTYLAVKRLAALRAAAGLLALGDDPEYAPFAKACEAAVEAALPKIEAEAWLGDHYAVSVEASATGVVDPATDRPVNAEELEGHDAYSLSTGNGLLLGILIGLPTLLDKRRLREDILAGDRENQSRYGDGHTSAEVENCWVSQNLWRDMLARYLSLKGPSSAAQYWDMQVMSNTHAQSLGYVDTYVNSDRSHNPRGIGVLGYYLAAPRLVVDRLAPGHRGLYITIDPDRGQPGRWPLLPLADWKAGKIPVCVIDHVGRVTLECQTDPVIIQGQADEEPVGEGLIG